MDHSALSAALVERVRGSMSQEQLSRRLGYGSNVLFLLGCADFEALRELHVDYYQRGTSEHAFGKTRGTPGHTGDGSYTNRRA